LSFFSSIAETFALDRCFSPTLEFALDAALFLVYRIVRDFVAVGGWSGYTQEALCPDLFACRFARQSPQQQHIAADGITKWFTLLLRRQQQQHKSQSATKFRHIDAERSIKCSLTVFTSLPLLRTG